MKIFISIKRSLLLLVTAATLGTACNKLELEPTPAEQPTPGTTPTIAALLDDPNFSLLKAAVTRAGLATTLADPSGRFTVFAPDNAAITASVAALEPGVAPLDFINDSLSPVEIASIIRYHVLPQVVKSASISGNFANFEYPSILNPRPDLSALFRLSTFPSVRANGAWVNNVPITGVDIAAVNGVVHKVAGVVLPPGKLLWDTSNTPGVNISKYSPNNSIWNDPGLTFLKAAITRADSGVAPGARLLDALRNPGANLTIFAPTDNAMKGFLTAAITRALVSQGTDLATAQATATFAVNTFGLAIISDPYNLLPPPYNAQLSAALTPTVVRGLLVYHVISRQSSPYTPPGVRVFSVNLPSTAGNVKTLLNSAVAVHPGLTVQANFVSPFPGVSVVSTATVKGAANATASNIVAKDIHFVNGVIHKIDQVLLPQ